MIAPAETDRADLVAYLQAQRGCVLAIVDGLDEHLMRQSVVPSGWTPLGMIEHLTGAERFWFEHVVTRSDAPCATVDDTVPAVLRAYREQGDRSDAALATVGLDGPPGGLVPDDSELAAIAVSVRSIVLHMIEETARHAGHLDIARELIDGRTGLGPR